MSENIKRFQQRALELAKSGKFFGFRPIAFELQFEPGYADAFQWLYSASTKEEIDRLCGEARRKTKPAAA